MVIDDPPAKASLQLRAGLEGVEVDALVFQRAPEALDEDIVRPPAQPSMLMRISASRSTLVKAKLVNWLP